MAEPRVSRRVRPWLVAFVLVTIALAALYERHRHYNFDLLTYGACVLILEGASEEEAHARVYEEVKRVAPPVAYGELVADPPPAWLPPSHGAYRADLARDADHFAQQLPFYRVKPLYLWVVAAVHAAGVDLVWALRGVTLVSFAAFGLLVFLWTARRTSDAIAFAVATPLLLMEPTSLLATAVSPDLPSLALVVAAAAAWIERRDRHLGVAAVLAALAVLMRPDNVIDMVLLIGVAGLYRPSGASLVRYGAVAAFLVVEYVAIGRLAHAYSWQTLFWNTVVAPLPAPADTEVHVTVGLYLDSLRNGWRNLWVALGSAPVAIAVLALAARRSLRDPRCGFIAAMLAAVLVRYVALPGADLRLLFAPMVLAMLQGAVVLHERFGGFGGKVSQ